MRGDSAETELRPATWNRPRAHGATVTDKVSGSLRSIGWIVAEASITIANVGDEIEVQSAVASSAQLFLHAHFVGVMGPVVIDCPVNISERVLEASTIKVII